MNIEKDMHSSGGSEGQNSMDPLAILQNEF